MTRLAVSRVDVVSMPPAPKLGGDRRLGHLTCVRISHAASLNPRRTARRIIAFTYHVPVCQCTRPAAASRSFVSTDQLRTASIPPCFGVRRVRRL